MDFRGNVTRDEKAFVGLSGSVNSAQSATESLRGPVPVMNADMLADRAMSLLNDAQEALRYIDEMIAKNSAEAGFMKSERERVIDLVQRFADRNAKQAVAL